MVLVGAFVVVGALAAPASAHATLESTTPVEGSALPAGSPPKSITLRFDEGVVVNSDSVQVFDGKGHAVNVSDVRQGTPDSVVTASLPHLPNGTYVVTWRVVSADSHPVQGAFSFGVGAAASSAASAQGLLTAHSDPAVGVAFGAVRALAFLGFLVLVGGLAFVCRCWPDARERRDVMWLLLVALGVVVVTSLLGIAFQAAYVRGNGFAGLFDGSQLRAVTHTRFGEAWLARGALALVVYGLARLRSRTVGARSVMVDIGFVGAAIAGCLTFTFAGHGDTGYLVPVGFVADLAHVAAAALWLGGLAVLAVGLRDPFELWGAARATARFSKLALPAIVVLALSGTAQAWRQTGTWASLWQTTYGHLLVAKIIVVCALVVAAYASRDVLRDRLVPALRVALGPGAARREAEPDDARELRNGVWVEAGLAIVILAITAALVNSQPAREAAAATPRTVTVHLSAPPMRFGVAAQPALPGNNTIVVAPQLTRGSPPLLQVKARIWLPGKVAPIPLAFAPLTNGRYAANVLIPFSGNWKLEVTGLRTATDESAAVTAMRFG
ncbi:MAG TPA: copper resistance protein CopC [Acidimicrobiia bacterium]